MWNHSVKSQVGTSEYLQRNQTDKKSDIIVPRGIENRVAINMVVEHVQRTLKEKSQKHQEELRRLGQEVEDEALSDRVLLLEQTRQIVGMNTIIQDPLTKEVDFIFYFDRLASLLVERYDVAILWVMCANTHICQSIGKFEFPSVRSSPTPR